jgi:ribonucleoside-diphosphate reductase alpha chain
LSVKKSKKGPLKQVVPQYQTLKNHYTLLWEMPSNEGYINIVSVMQKFFDQAISGNWSYNPTHFPDNEVPMSVMMKDLLNTYKYGWKTSYYQNTYDYKSDGDIVDETKQEPLARAEFNGSDEEYDEHCEACAI